MTTPSGPWALACCLLASGAFAQEPPDPATKSVAIVRIGESQAPRIDGRLDDAAWASAAIIDDLQQFQPNEGEAPSQRSQFYVMHDKDALYVGARLFDTEPDRVRAQILRQGERLSSDDKFGILLDTFNDKRNGYRFEVNLNGVRDDGLFLDSNLMQWDWEGIYTARAVRTEEGWTAEIAVPFKTLNYDPEKSTWGFNVLRVISRNSERIGWVSRNRNQTPASSGELTGLVGMDSGRGLDLVPGASFRNERDLAGGTSTSKLEPSLDVYYKLTPGLNASFTVNTDFSATEVDDRQVNLSQFSLFFPEKRGFFLRESDIFEFGRLKGGDLANAVNATFSRSSMENGRPFFSRSIGLSATGEPVDLVAGAKVSGRVGGFNVGALMIRQDEFANVDAQDLFVGRAVANVLSESSLGLIATSGNPRADLNNSLLGADFRYANTRLAGNRSVEGEAWFQRSWTQGLESDDRAYGVRLRSPNSTGWRGGVGLKTLEANFNPAMGYVNRRGIRYSTAEAGYTSRWRTGRVQSLHSGLDFEQFDSDITGSLQSRAWTWRPLELQTRQSDNLKLRYVSSTEVLSQPFTISQGVVLPVGEYDFDEVDLDFESAGNRTVQTRLNYRVGDFYDGERWKLLGKVVWKPSAHFWFTGSYEYQDVELPEGEFLVRLMSGRFDIMFDATWAWVTLLQYDNVTDSVGVHSRVRWIPQAGREVFLVYNHNLLENAEDGDFHSAFTESVVKLNYTFRF